MKQLFQVFCLYILIFLATITCHAQLDENNILPHEKKPKAKALVVYYSRTANTEVMAKEIVKCFQADLVPIKSDNFVSDILSQKQNIQVSLNLRKIAVNAGFEKHHLQKITMTYLNPRSARLEGDIAGFP